MNASQPVDSTECCPPFDPAKWQDREFNWQNQPFVKGQVRSFMHIPLNMGKVIPRMWQQIKTAGAEPEEFIMLSHDVSPWKSEQYIRVKKEVPGMDNVQLSGTFLAKVFEGPYREARNWCAEMSRYVAARNKEVKKLFFYYTTCPKCAKARGKNYVVGVAQV